MLLVAKKHIKLVVHHRQGLGDYTLIEHLKHRTHLINLIGLEVKHVHSTGLFLHSQHVPHLA